MANCLAVVPCRYGSTRFPGKPLVQLLGKPMVQHVVERCREAGVFSRVIVATDDERISSAVKSFGGEVVMTSPECASGTDRVAEVARGLSLESSAVVVNVQGDEPAVRPEALVALTNAFTTAAVVMATLVRPLRDDERTNSNVVKAVLGEANQALYFSRADLPFQRDTSTVQRWAHVGLYGYRSATLQRLAALVPTELERSEALEQLRALGHGIGITCVRTELPNIGVDRPEDVPAAERALAALLG